MIRLKELIALTTVATTLVFAVERPAAKTTPNAFAQTILVANRPGFDPNAMIDDRLINPWGIALRPPGAGGHIWISNAGTLSSSTYIGDAHGVPLHQDGLTLVYLRGPLLSYEDGLANVTGLVYNIASDFADQPLEFPVSGPASDLTGGTPMAIGDISGPAKFVFVTTEGTINAWRSNTASSMDRAPIVKDYSDHGPDQLTAVSRIAAFTGVAMSAEAKRPNRLYVTDFQNRTIRVIDHTWKDITADVPFRRPSGLPAEFSPYNIQLLGNRLYVTYAVVDPVAEEAATDIPGPGNGHVVAYDLDGHLVQQFADAGRLNSPWGVAIAPKEFGPFAGNLLVASFGDGTIAAFDLATGAFEDYLRGPDGRVLSIDGIWGLTFGNGVSLGDADSLYFTAGPNNEQDGIFGRVRHVGSATSSSFPHPSK